MHDQVTLNTSRRRQSNPNVLPGNFALITTVPDSSTTHSDSSRSSGSSSSAILLPFLNNGGEATSPSTDPTETPVLRPNPWVGPGANIIPAALSDRDVLRLTWAVQRVRELMAGLAAAEDHPGSGKGLFEVSPGTVRDNSTSTEADYLNTWVSMSHWTLSYVTLNVVYTYYCIYRYARMCSSSLIGWAVRPWEPQQYLQLLLILLCPAQWRAG